MEKENNAICTRESCKYEFHSILVSKGKMPKQCPMCKQYKSIEATK